MKLVIVYVLVLLALAAGDFVWLGLTTEMLYRPAMGELLRTSFNMPAAIGFYLLYGFGLSWLIVLPAVSGEARINLVDLSLRAALFGLVAFGTYDLTGLAVIRNWPQGLSFIDMAWGTVAAIIAANVAVLGLRVLGQVK